MSDKSRTNMLHAMLMAIDKNGPSYVTVVTDAGPTDHNGQPRAWKAGDNLMFPSADGTRSTLERIEKIGVAGVKFAKWASYDVGPDINIQNHLTARCQFITEAVATDMRRTALQERPMFTRDVRELDELKPKSSIKKTVDVLVREQEARHQIKRNSDEFEANAILDAEAEMQVQVILDKVDSAFEGKMHGGRQSGFRSALAKIAPYLLQVIREKNAPVVGAKQVVSDAQPSSSYDAKQQSYEARLAYFQIQLDRYDLKIQTIRNELNAQGFDL